MIWRNPRKPKFRFFPRAYEIDGVFEKSETICDACKEPAVWLYKKSLYGTRDMDVCARCIHEGRIAGAIGKVEFSFHDAELTEDVPDEIEAEIMQRTPGFATYNPFDWPVLDGLPLAFLGYGDEKAFKRNSNADKAIRHAGKTLGEDNWRYPCSYTLLFESLDGKRLEASVDLD